MPPLRLIAGVLPPDFGFAGFALGLLAGFDLLVIILDLPAK